MTSTGDDFEKHVADTLEAGDGLCDDEAVREIVRDGPARIDELAEMLGGARNDELDGAARRMLQAAEATKVGR